MKDADTIAQIHPELIFKYDLAYASARAYARSLYATATIGQLRAAQEERSKRPGLLTIRERAWERAHQDEIEELIEEKFLESAHPRGEGQGADGAHLHL